MQSCFQQYSPMVRGTLPWREGMALYSLVLQGAAYWLRAASYSRHPVCWQPGDNLAGQSRDERACGVAEHLTLSGYASRLAAPATLLMRVGSS